ncbi:MAG: MOSC domain-containing protein [Pseudomonadales bacterium]
MRLESVNVGRRERLSGRHFDGYTGIGKRPVAGPVAVSELGLGGDAIIDTRHHGGPDQAVYAYRQEDYAWWSAELGRPLEPGTFGDNLTLSGLAEAGLVVGTRLVFEQVVLEVTAPRIPCNTLAQRMGDAGFVKRFMRGERPGFYCRVVRTGAVTSGEPFTLIEHQGVRVSTVQMFRDRHAQLDAAALRRYLSVPIDERSRSYFEGKLAELGG